MVSIVSPLSGSAFLKNSLAIEIDIRSLSGAPVEGVDVLIDGRPIGTRGLARVDEPPAQADPVKGERRTITIAIWVSVVALAFAYVVMPFAQRVLARQAEIALRRAQVGRLTAYMTRQAEIEKAVASRTSVLEAYGTRVLRGRSPSLVGAELQRVLQDYAHTSRVSVSRLDVPGVADSTRGETSSMPATLSAVGDVYGLAQLLTLLQQGPFVIEVRDLSITSTSALRGELLQVSLTARAPFVVEAPR